MGLCIDLRNSTSITLSLARRRFLIVLRPMTNAFPLRDRVQKCVKPRKSKVSGFPSPVLTLLGRVTAEADQPGLVRVQRQFERAYSLLQIVQEGLCLVLMLEADDGVVCIANDNHIARRLLAPTMGPQVVHVVQVDVRQDR